MRVNQVKVLIADDEVDLRVLLSEVFQRLGLQTLVARNGSECLLMVKREHPDAVVLDLTMPGLNGIEALKEIRKVDPRIPVVVLTASTYPVLHQTARALGATAVYTKPCDLEQFARHVASLASS